MRVPALQREPAAQTSRPPRVPGAPTAEWYRIRDGRIAAIRVFFDARPFASLFEVCSPLLRGRELGSGS